MIIDFRLRPATRGFLNMHIFRNQDRIARWSGNLGMTPPPSAKQGNMELMLKEMEEGGVTMGVVPGRQANPFMGNVPNDDIVDIVRQYPDKFIGVAGIDPTVPGKAIDEIEPVVVNGPLAAVGMEPGVLPNPMYCDDRRIYPIYEYCERHGGCTLHEKEMKHRIFRAGEQNVPMVNYGIFIAYVNGILARSVEVFPEIQKELPANEKRP